MATSTYLKTIRGHERAPLTSKFLLANLFDETQGRGYVFRCRCHGSAARFFENENIFAFGITCKQPFNGQFLTIAEEAYERELKLEPIAWRVAIDWKLKPQEQT